MFQQGTINNKYFIFQGKQQLSDKTELLSSNAQKSYQFMHEKSILNCVIHKIQ